jgi:hypothetical protein
MHLERKTIQNLICLNRTLYSSQGLSLYGANFVIHHLDLY